MIVNRWLPPEHRRQRLSTLLAVSLLVLILVSIRASISNHDEHGELASPATRAAVMKQATRWTERVMTYDAATADTDIATAKALMTDQMQADFERSLPLAADRDDQAAKGVKVTTRVARIDDGGSAKRCPANACAIGLMSLRDDRASVLLFVNQYATANTTKKTVVNPTWQILRLVRQDDAWKIAGMKGP